MYIHLLATSKQFSTHIQVRIYRACGIEQRHTHVKRGRMTIVDPESVKDARKGLDIFGHVVPEPWVVARPVAVPKFNTVAPYDDFAPEVGFGWWERKVGERIGGPDPAVVGHGERAGVVFGCPVVLWDACKVGVDEGHAGKDVSMYAP